MELNRYQKAAAIGNTKQRERALERYYQNPNKCKYCNKIIEVKYKEKTRDARNKKFCNSSCAAIFNNQNRVKIVKTQKDKQVKIKTPFKFLFGLTKLEIFTKHKNWQSARTSIRKHANHVFDESGKPKMCCYCGYRNHYEVAHIKAVSEFTDDSLIEEINHIDNLMALCPNHHWEFDNNILKI